MKTSLCILAAGNSSRFIANKLLTVFKGKSLIEHLFEKVDRDLFDQVLVVTQYDHVAQMALEYGFQVVFNHHPSLGISYSIKLGVKACTSNQMMFIVSDMPNIKVNTLKKMVEVSDGKTIVSAVVDDELYNPMIFPRCTFEELNELTGDKGAKRVALVHDVIKVAVDLKELKDIDTPEDLKKLTEES